MRAIGTGDPEADLFEATERRLDEWGRFCRSRTQELGIPTISNFAQMSEHVRRQERDDRKRRREKLKARMAGQRLAGVPIDCKDVAEASGAIEPEPTARGSETRSMHAARVVFSAAASRVEAVINALPKWQRTPIYRTYLYGQPHRIAARELRMDESDYQSRWRSAVKEVGRLLAMRESGAVD